MTGESYSVNKNRKPGRKRREDIALNASEADPSVSEADAGCRQKDGEIQLELSPLG